jgi:hypothetical protein
MPNYNKKISDTLIRIGEVRNSYVHVFAPRTGDDGKAGKYGVCLVWPKSDTQTTELVKSAINAAKELAKTKGIKLPTNCKTPLRDGDIDREEDENFAGCWFINANCAKKPGVRVLENGQIVEALDEEDFYSGCYGAATVNFFPYDSNGNKGIGAGLNNVIKTRDGERLSGGTSAESDFSDLGSLDCLN